MYYFPQRIRDSIQLKLSIWLSVAIVMIAILAGVFSFFSAFHEANEIQDDLLRQVIALVDREQWTISPSRFQTPSINKEEESRVIVQDLLQKDSIDFPIDNGGMLPLSSKLPDGLHTIDIQAETYRVLVKTLANGKKIAVSQETDLRDEIARDSALRTVMPILMLVPILLIVVSHLIRTLFKPIRSIAADIDNRKEQSLDPVEDKSLPLEIRPFTNAINRLLGRVSHSIENQRRFLADAAHELRSPLTALTLQIERLSETDLSVEAEERLAPLKRGIYRSRNLIDQLLTLARTQSTTLPQKTIISITYIYRRVLEDLLPLAEAKLIDIGIEGNQDIHILMNETESITLIKNIVDNAIHYTPEGGKVDLAISLQNDKYVLQIKDSGPGIPVVEQLRIFDPFYRVLGNETIGSGLGLSIVKAIADRYDIKIDITSENNTTKSGLLFRLILPDTLIAKTSTPTPSNR